MNKKLILFIVGFILVITGVALTLRDWLFVVWLFRGAVGPVLAVSGFVVMVLGRPAKVKD